MNEVWPNLEYRGLPKPLNPELRAKLTVPIDCAADWHLDLGPAQWYGEVFSGDFKDPVQVEHFQKQLTEKTKDNPRLKDPYTYVDSKWKAHSIARLPEVYKDLSKLEISLGLASRWINRNVHDPATRVFGNYLAELEDLTARKAFQGMMEAFLRQPLDTPILFMAMPVEYNEDPFNIRYSPQGLLAVVNREATDAANSEVEQATSAAHTVYRSVPLKAKVFFADADKVTGYLGKDEKISAQNIPNDYRVGRKIGNNVIYILINRMAKLNQDVLSPELKELCDLTTSSEDVQRGVIMHEISHGYREEQEENLGSLRSPVREGWANDRAMMITSAADLPDGYLESVVKMQLAYARYDLGRDLSRVVFNSFGDNQPDLNKLLTQSPYALSGYLVLRKAYLEGGIDQKGRLELDKFVMLAEQRDQLWEGFARSGNEADTRKVLKELVQERRTFPGISSFRGIVRRMIPTNEPPTSQLAS